MINPVSSLIKALPLLIFFIAGAKVGMSFYLLTSAGDAETFDQMTVVVRHLSDNFGWLMMMVFFISLYLYKRGTVGLKTLQHATSVAALACGLKSLASLLSIYTIMTANKWVAIFYVLEFAAWMMVLAYLCYYKLKLNGKLDFLTKKKEEKKQRQHHHHHHREREKAEISKDNQ